MSHSRTNCKLLFLLIFFSALGGCSTGTPYQPPNTETPQTWRDIPASGTAATDPRWWSLYGDANLDALVDEALAHNRDLALAAARVDEARALARIADAQQAPSVDGALQRDRTRRSDSTATRFPGALENNNYRTQINISYELDLWGRLSSAARAARADLLATEAARDTVRIALTSEIVKAYFGLVAFDSQIASTRKSLDLRQENLRLQTVRASAGLINDFALRQLEAEVSAAQAQLPALEQRRLAQELALGVLLGRNPGALIGTRIVQNTTTAMPATPVIPQGLPSELLLRRPDIAESEQRLIAAHARIEAARAALFPRISLTAFLGSESADLGSLFSGPARIWSLGYALTQPIFQAGRLSGQIEAVKAREQQTLIQYQQTVQNAFRETQEALSAQTRAREIVNAESARTAALSEALRLARIRYENGITSQLELLDAERNLLNAELNRADALRAQRAAVADVVRALGGGWARQ